MREYEKNKPIIENIVIVMCVVLIWSLGCAYRGIYPFGDKLMDVGDMQAQIVPMYTFLWDVLHGNKTIFFDWSTGLGNNMSGAAWHFTLFSPFNLFFLFIKRSQIEKQLFLFLLLKLIAIGMSFRFVIRRWFPGLSTAAACGFSLLYVFSPFSIEYYRFPAWMDVVFLFPLVMYFYFELMNRGRKAGFVVCLTMTAVMNFQHTFLLAIFLTLATGGLLLLDRERYRRRLVSLAQAVVMAAGISACVWLPGILQIMTGKRFDGSVNLIDIWDSVWIFHPSKWLKCFNLGLPLSLFVWAAVRRRQDKKTKLWFASLILLLGLPILLESSNLLWHGGLYQGYTMRFAYMLTFWCVMAGSWGYQTLREQGVSGQLMSGVKVAAEKILSCILLAALAVLSVNIVSSGNSLIKTAITVVISFALGSLLLPFEKMKNIMIFAVSILLSLALTASNMQAGYTVETSDIGVYNEMRESGYQTDTLSRMKAASGAWTSNYPMALGCPSISNYLAAEGADQIESFIRLGYAEIGLRMSDYGGTLFSDALFGMDHLIASGDTEADSDLYRQAYSYRQDYGIYDSVYTYPTGILVDSQTALAYGEDPFENQNAIAAAVCGRELFTTYQTDTDELCLPVEAKSVLYVYMPAGNSEDFAVTYTKDGVEKQRTVSGGGWDNGILNLGVYDSGEVRVSISGRAEGETVRAAVLSLEEFENSQPQFAEKLTYTAGKHSLSVYAECQDANKSLFLPVYCDRGWTCRVNGKQVTLGDAISGGMLIPLEQGANEIELVYVSPGLYAGLAISLVSLLLVLLYAGLAIRRRTATEPEASGGTGTVTEPGLTVWEQRVNALLAWAVYIVYGAAVAVLYLIPLVFFVKCMLGL